MPTPDELKTKFWKALKSDMTMMLELNGVEDGHTRPMTAQVDGDAERGPLWFFATNDSLLVKHLKQDSRAIATFTSKDHDLFATVHGGIVVDNDRAVIDRLWNSHIAAWYEGGKDDPKLTLLRLDAENAEVWLEGSSIIAGIKMMFGSDPKQDYKDNMAKVSLA